MPAEVSPFFDASKEIKDDDDDDFDEDDEEETAAVKPKKRKVGLLSGMVCGMKDMVNEMIPTHKTFLELKEQLSYTHH